MTQLTALAETIRELGTCERAALGAAFAPVLRDAELSAILEKLRAAGLITIAGDSIQWMKFARQ